jgi:predicted CopG family antitoxin
MVNIDKRYGLKHIKVKQEIYDELKKLKKNPEDSFNVVVRRLLKFYYFVNKKVEEKRPKDETKKEVLPSERFNQEAEK